jgi:putative thioredoxin
MSSQHVLELNDSTFDQTVSSSPVLLVDFWAPWCGPCRTLGPLLEKLESQESGRFRLAKLNADEVPQLSTQISQMFGVRSIPFCVLFMGGQPVDAFVGALPESEIRAFLDRHLPPAAEPAPEPPAQDADSARSPDADPDAPLNALRHSLAQDPQAESVRAELMALRLARDASRAARRKPAAGIPASDVWMRSMPSCSATATARTSQSGRTCAIASSEPRMYRPMPVGGTLSGVTSQATRTP